MIVDRGGLYICDFDGPIGFIIASIDQYEGPDFQDRIVSDQHCILRRLVRGAAFDADHPITHLTVVGRT
jgi:hypothetical protein